MKSLEESLYTVSDVFLSDGSTIIGFLDIRCQRDKSKRRGDEMI